MRHTQGVWPRWEHTHTHAQPDSVWICLLLSVWRSLSYCLGVFVVYLCLCFSFFCNLHLLFLVGASVLNVRADIVNQKFSTEKGCTMRWLRLYDWEHYNLVLWTFYLKLVPFVLKYNFNSRNHRKLAKSGSSSTHLIIHHCYIYDIGAIFSIGLFPKKAVILVLWHVEMQISLYCVQFVISLKLAPASPRYHPSTGRDFNLC